MNALAFANWFLFVLQQQTVHNYITSLTPSLHNFIISSTDNGHCMRRDLRAYQDALSIHATL